MAQLMPLPLTVSCFSKLQIGFTFLVLAHLGSPGKKAIKQVCVQGLCPSDPLTRGSVPGPRWVLCPRPPTIQKKSLPLLKGPQTFTKFWHFFTPKSNFANPLVDVQFTWSHFNTVSPSSESTASTHFCFFLKNQPVL